MSLLVDRHAACSTRSIAAGENAVLNRMAAMKMVLLIVLPKRVLFIKHSVIQKHLMQ